ncbi:MAG: hypothetical protein JWR26_4239 [Pedosphaera sp.]|nr:hypothetical protein [Pedosphaera sp.]
MHQVWRSLFILSFLCFLPGVTSQPAQAATPLAWFKADAITSIANGAPLQTWADSTTNGFNATQPMSGNRPTYISGVMNGHPVVHFNSTNNTYLAFTRPVQDDFTILCVFRSTQGIGAGTLYYQGAGLVNGEVGGVVNDFGTSLFANGSVAAGTGQPDVAVDSGPGYNDGNPHIMTFKRTRSTGEVDLYMDGVLMGTTFGGTNSLMAPAQLVLGAQQTLNNYLLGDVAEVQIYNTPLSDTDRQTSESALAAKYAVSYGTVTGMAFTPANFVIYPGGSIQVSLTIPASANASSAVSVTVTNGNTNLVTLSGAVGGVLTVTFPAGGTNAAYILVQGVGSIGTATLTARSSGFVSALATAACIPAPVVMEVWRATSLTNSFTNGASVTTWIGLSNGTPATAVVGAPTLDAHATLSGLPALAFNQAALDVAGASSPVQGLTSFTVGIVFRVTAAGVGGEPPGTQWYNQGGLVDAEQPGVTQDWGISLNNTGELNFGVGNPDTTIADSGNNLVGPLFHAAVVTLDGSQMRLMVDDHTPFTVALGSWPTGRNASDIHIGASSPNNNNLFSGEIAEIRFYNGVINVNDSSNLISSLKSTYGLVFSLSQLPPSPGQPTASPASTVYAGTTVTLSVPVTGVPPYPYYQWRKNGTNISFGTSAVLTLTNTAVADSGSYDVLVGNGNGTNASGALVVTINPPSAPIFTMQPTPASAQIYQNGLVTFSASVSGSPPISLQWRFNGTNLAGETLNSLTLSNLGTNNSGNYTLVASNHLGTNASSPATLTVLPLPTNSFLDVLTYHNDNLRTGQNTNELVLTLANVNTNSFGQLFSQAVDGAVYAQPLYVAGLNVPGKGTHNAVFVATQHGSVYAFDADSKEGTNAAPLWQVSFINPAAGITPLTPADVGGCPNIPHEECIAATPAIDLGTGTIYLEALTREVTNGAVKFVHRLHALNISTGAEQLNSPVVIQGSAPGSGAGGNGTTIVFDPLLEQCRTGLLLQNGFLYFGFSAQCDGGSYHGWVMAYNAQTLQQVGIYNATPNGGLGGIWHGGDGMVGDAAGGIFAMTGNGTFGTNYAAMNQYNLSDSFLKFTGNNGLTLIDYFTPYNEAALSGADLDVSAGGPMGLPDSIGTVAHPHLILGCGKDGTIYLLDRDNLGHFNAANDAQIVQELPNVVGTPWNFPVPAYFNNAIYYQGNADVLRAFHIAGAAITTTPVATSTVTFGSPGGVPSVSANGTSNGIVWAIQTDAWGSGGPAILHAYNATNLVELYNSGMIPERDDASAAIKWVAPTIANGKVYIGSDYALTVYGNGVFLATPAIAPSGAVFTNSVTVTLSDATPGTTIYYSWDGTLPTTNSAVYTGPFVVTNSTGIHAMAVRVGAVNSGVASASFVNSSSVGTGTGLTGAYYANQNQTFNGSPTLVRVDTGIDFNWNTVGPDPSIGRTGFTARWTGTVQPQFTETYTFYATADDGVRLWVNGQLLLDAWITQGATTYSGSIALKAQQLYDIQMDYFQGGGGASAELQWSSPSSTLAVIPQTQLYPYTNPPPVVVLNGPASNSTFTAAASVTLNATAAAQTNAIDHVAFYAGGTLLGILSNAPYVFTATGLAAGNYALTATATDSTGLSSTSAPLNIVVQAGRGSPYGLTSRSAVPAFFNMPGTFNGALPARLSQTGVFTNTPNLAAAPGLIPYTPNTPLWSDNALKNRWMAVPYSGGLATPGQQIGFAPTGEWSFPAGTVFVKNFSLVTDETNTNAPVRRLETRLLVCDTNGAVYGVTYKWRPDNSDADLLASSLSEAILITNAMGMRTQTWYYPSSADCLACHTPAANYVLGVKTRQLNGNLAYPSSGVTDNQLRALNHLGIFNPSFDEAGITNYAQMVSVTDQTATLANRVRSYIDANCAQCHRPGGPGPSFDARYDTALTNQNIINGNVIANLGVDHAHVVNAQDIWRSTLYQRANSLTPGVKMPPLARNVIDTNAMAIIAAWINSLPGTPALAPPVLSPAGGAFVGTTTLTVLPPVTNAVVYYTLDGSLPTTNSLVYSAPITLTNSASVSATAFKTGFTNSVAAKGVFTIISPILFASSGTFSSGVFRVSLSATPNQNYILQGSSNLVDWIALSTNTPLSSPFYLADPSATNAPKRFYRVLLQF